jgi:hypothetical protein
MSAVFMAVIAVLGLQGSGSLAGIVQTADGLTVPRLTLTIAGPARTVDVVTDDAGRFRLAALPDGDYQLTVVSQLLTLRAPISVSLHGQDERLLLTVVPADIKESISVSAPAAEAPLSGSPGMTVSVMTDQQIQARNASSFAQLIQDLPGVSVSRSGGIGSIGSAYIRGGEPNYALVLVDGVTVNDPGGAYDLGKQLPLELERVEVTRGVPASQFGGGLSGLFSLTTRSAKGDAGTLSSGDLELGSFRWRRLLGATSGRSDRLDWNVGALGVTTDNQQPNSAFGQAAGALSMGVALNAQTSLRIVSRADIGVTGTPGPTALIRPNLHAKENSDSAVIGARLRHLGRSFEHEWRLNFSLSDKLALNPRDAGPINVTMPGGGNTGRGPTFVIPDFSTQDGLQNNTRRLAVAYQGDGVSIGRHSVMFGVEIERETGALGVNGTSATAPQTARGPLQGLGLTSPVRLNEAVYVQDRLTFHDNVLFTTGARLEHNGSFGIGLSPRAAIAWTLRAGKNSTTLKSSAGAGIKEPTFEQSFGGTFGCEGIPTSRRNEVSRSTRVWISGCGMVAFARRRRCLITSTVIRSYSARSRCRMFQSRPTILILDPQSRHPRSSSTSINFDRNTPTSRVRAPGALRSQSEDASGRSMCVANTRGWMLPSLRAAAALTLASRFPSVPATRVHSRWIGPWGACSLERLECTSVTAAPRLRSSRRCWISTMKPRTSVSTRGQASV